jgi:hypothetical protein
MPVRIKHTQLTRCSASHPLKRQALRVQHFTPGSPDDHNGKQAPSRFSNPGRFGCNIFAYPVQCSYKRDARTSLFQPYRYLLTSRFTNAGPSYVVTLSDWD